ncbi:cytidine deaminase [Vagococcus zengguangii]|uniref:Cytidine deaminase n=1 Tax=Vagococcus zengguangii TaxID=2571750 RepID=A0A4D7CSF7_9ENTE|nr:cytidine deaminase [Vagococcus zengguangii]QCI85480.1 cytidine deaminase [Vagococcus zengguangii]TLG80025.1 cytidine deaminase [Vagococcus zengguangii]
MGVDKKNEWVQLAQDAYTNSYVPYSHFPVGACLVAKDGQVFTGVNVENASFGLTNCAERTAFFKAVSEGQTEFQHLVVAAKSDDPVAPCGACRQVMIEFCEPTMGVTLVSKDGQLKETTVGELLPYSFTDKQMEGN